MPKKTVSTLIILLLFCAILASCGDTAAVTLDGMKKSLESAGYTINEKVEFPDGVTGAFSFEYSGNHGKVNIIVCEFENETQAKDFLENLSLNNAGIVKDKYVASVDHAHDGKLDSDTEKFLEDVLNGNKINK